MKKYLKWKISININNQEYIGNKLLAKGFSLKGYDAIINGYVYIYPDNVKKTLQIIPEAWESLKGVGIDLGGGIGCVSSTIALKNNVKKIYSLEIVEDVVRLCQPIVINKILKNKSHKVISVIGSFDNIELEDNSLDFAVAWQSLHHSNNPVITLKECYRVLKPEGKFIIIDRAHNNSTPDSEIERILNIVYNEEFLAKNYRPKDTILTRRENGEHEYRFCEWDNFFKESGFKLVSSVVIKTDTPENRCLKNDNNLREIFINHKVGGYKKRLFVGYVLLKI